MADYEVSFLIVVDFLKISDIINKVIKNTSREDYNEKNWFYWIRCNGKSNG